MLYKHFERYVYMFVCFLTIVLEVFPQSINKIRIDPSKAYGGTVSEYFSEIEYIPLETTKESILGEIKQMIITDSSMVVTDYDTKTIFFFNINGKFISKVKTKANTIPVIWYLSEKKSIQIVFINILTNISEVTEYSIFGIPLNKFSGVQPINNVILVSLNNGYFACTKNCYRASNEKLIDSVYNLIEIYKDNKLYKSFLPFNPKINPGVCTWGGGWLRPITIVQNGFFYISTPLEHILYKVNKDTTIKLAQFIFPYNRSFSEKIINNSNPKFIDSMRVEMYKDYNHIIHVSNIMFNKQFMLFKISPWIPAQYPGSDDYRQYNFIFDTISKKLVSVERISPDFKSYYLPILDKDGYVLSNTGFVYKDNIFYTDISSLLMFKSKEITQNKHPQYPYVLQQYFKTQTRESNPVIVKMKLKDF